MFSKRLDLVSRPFGVRDSSTKKPPIWLLAGRYLWWRFLGLWTEHLTLETVQGILTVSTRDHGLAGQLYRHGQYEYYSSIEALQFLKSRGFVATADFVLLDIGANIGLIGIGLLRQGEVRRVVAIEPEPGNFALMMRNISHNGLDDKMLPVQRAVTNAPATLTLRLSRNNNGDHRVEPAGSTGLHQGDSLQVQGDSLDNILQYPEVSSFTGDSSFVLWMDVQGFERQTFQGADGLLRKGTPVICELWPDGLARAGTTFQQYVETVSLYFSHYFRKIGSGFTEFPVHTLPELMEEHYAKHSHENLIFVR